MTSRSVRRGEIWWLDWSPARGSEQAGERPALVIQNDVGNQYSPTTIVAAITTSAQRRYPFIVPLSASVSGLPRDSSVNASQILTVDKSRLRRIAGRIDGDTRAEVDRAIMISLGLDIES